MKCVFYATLSGLILLTMTPVWGAGKTILVKPQDCPRFTRHVPQEDVAYKAGVDVKGKMVAPADITPPTGLEGRDKYSFYMVRDVSKNPGIKQEIILGFVEVKKGQVSLNGKPLSVGQQGALQAFCARRIKDN